MIDGVYVDNKIILEKDLIVEAPVLIKSGTYSVNEIGAFTYFNGRTFSKNVKSVGRYCSIAPDITLGHYAHPTNTISHHNVFFGIGKWMEDFHSYKNDTFNKKHIKKKSGEIIIGNDVWIGAHVFVMNGIEIGDGAIIGGGSIVTHDVPPFAVVGGNPASIIRYRFSQEIIKTLLELKWWNYGPEILNNTNLIDINECINVIKQRIKEGIKPYKANKYVIDKTTHAIRLYER